MHLIRRLSVAYFVIQALGAPVWHWLVRPWEEVDLVRRFGDAYIDYRYNVSCWIPRLSPWRMQTANSETEREARSQK
jgi:protein-S-isoprenylcysteine O-methyltransferase Ste14